MNTYCVAAMNKAGDTVGDRAKRKGKTTAAALQHIKYSHRLVTCSFDKTFLFQPHGFISALTTRLDCATAVAAGKVGNTQLPDWVLPPHPPPIFPVDPALHGVDGPVPLPMSISWQRHTPVDTPDATVRLTASEEPDVLLILQQDACKGLLATDPDSNQHFLDLVTSVRNLNRPVSMIFFIKPSQMRSPLYEVIARLQVDHAVRGVQQVTSVEDLATLVCNYTKSICQRPFKQGRMEATDATSAAAAVFRFPRRNLVCAGAQTPEDAEKRWEAAVRAWVHRTWLSQLGQWHGVTGEVATAIATVYPTPRCLFEAIWQGADENTSLEAVQEKATAMLADLPIRRGAGILATQNRLGPQLARRIVTFFTSPDPLDEGAS
ncbi:crossover junction endonuclease eme1 [Sparganum proliferum]